VMLALLAIGPLLLDRIRLVEAERSERMAVAAREALEIARRDIESQQEGLAAARAMLEVAARSYVVMGAKPDGCDSLLGALVAGVRWIRTLSVARPDGRIVCSTSPRATGINLADQSYFQGVQHTGEWTLSDYMVARRPRAPILMAALPVPAGGGFTGGVLIAGLDPQWIGRLETAVGGQRNAVALMVDGRVVVARDRSASRDKDRSRCAPRGRGSRHHARHDALPAGDRQHRGRRAGAWSRRLCPDAD